MNSSEGKLRVSLTDAGRTIVCGTCFVLLSALIVPAFGVLSALVAILLVSVLVGYVLRPRIRISGNLPDRIVAGQTVLLRYEFKNVARLPTYNFSVSLEGLPDAIEQIGVEHMVSRLGPGETIEMTLEIRAKRRGHHHIRQPVCESGFPFNLVNFSTASKEEQTLIVLPVFSRIQFPIRNLSRHVSAGGTRLAGLTGVFPEYAGNRPFVAGDSPRRIDSRAWARLSVPATKEYHDDFDNHMALVLDTSPPEVSGQSLCPEIPQLEAAVSLCASVAFSIGNHCLIDVLLAGPDLYTFDGWPRNVRLDKTHEILAGVEPHEQYDMDQLSPALTDRFYELSEVVFILLSWNEEYEQLLDAAQRAGCHSTVLVVGAAEEADLDRYFASWATNVRFLSPDEILTGQTRRL